MINYNISDLITRLNNSWDKFSRVTLLAQGSSGNHGKPGKVDQNKEKTIKIPLKMD